jgi:hypothetical protein
MTELPSEPPPRPSPPPPQGPLLIRNIATP